MKAPKAAGEFIKDNAEKGANWANNNPAAVCASGGVAVVAAPVILTAPLLAAAGFTMSGVAAGE
ncbi:hypothetical protein B0T25DRAFT_567855 [Lasiosphaeria hispida]|uniref:Uncharacterized protein n=1 Tax=Lasiosphaeria hispida TaxID=260671 RepID=A0AAJ0HHK3_9PEZI|nr:hypothetical protein B0T25DRAFT_567855 [Lasiosphaeria hispida]